MAKMLWHAEVDEGVPKMSTRDYYKYRIFAVFDDGNVGMSGVDLVNDRLA